MSFYYVFMFFLVSLKAQSPPRSCPSDRPFMLNDYGCGSYHETCFKIGDEQCSQFQNACKQCPPSNITIFVLKNIQIRLTELELSSKNVQLMVTNIANASEIRFKEINRNINRISSIVITILMISILIISILCILILYRNKFKTVCSRSFRAYEEQEYSLLQRGSYIENFIMQLQKIEQIMQLQNISTDITFCTIRFQFDGMDQEPIELYVHNNHNIVQVKQQICAKLPHAKHDDYKIMKLKYNGIILNDDNQYLLKNIHQSNTIVNCFIDSSMNASDIVVVKLQGKMSLPDIIQINKNQTIDQLKELIWKIIDSQDFSLFKQSNGSIKTEELKDNLYELVDGDWIRIVTKEFGKLIIRSIFNEDSFTIEFINVDLVSSLMTSISNKFNWHLNNFVLFYNNKCLDENKYIFEYQISSESAVKYCCFMKWVDINMDDDYIIKGNFSELRYGTNMKSNKKVLIKKYEVKSSKDWKDEEFMLKELITFQITKSHRRFIQLLGVYIDDVILYIVMENMDGGTLKTFLKENYEKLDKNKIYKWSAQILEGLKFLHENKVIHRDLNPSSILVDGNDDLKLSSFNLSKYLDIYKPSSIMGKQNNDKREELPVRYMAPELLNGDKYGEACDVWSFGAVLIRIITNKKPYSNSTKSEALKKISKKETIEYKLLDKYSEFKSIIDSCLKMDPSEREKIGKLIYNENIGKYIY